MTMKEKHDESLKGRFCADRQKQRGTMEKDKPASSSMALDLVSITAVIKAVQKGEKSQS